MVKNLGYYYPVCGTGYSDYYDKSVFATIFLKQYGLIDFKLFAPQFIGGKILTD